MRFALCPALFIVLGALCLTLTSIPVLSQEEGRTSVETQARRRAEIEKRAHESERRKEQIDHAWDGHEEEFRKIGIVDKTEFAKYIEDIRSNPDIHMPLPRNRELYARIDDGKAGTIVIDNPGDKNGGTAFRNPDVRKRVDELKEAP